MEDLTLVSDSEGKSTPVSREERRRSTLGDELVAAVPSKKFRKYAATIALRKAVQDEKSEAEVKTTSPKGEKEVVNRINSMVFGKKRIRSLSEDSEPEEKSLTPSENKYVKTCYLTKRLHDIVLTQAEDIRTLLRADKKGDMKEKIAKVTETYKAIAQESRDMEETYLKEYPSGVRLFNHDEEAEQKFKEWMMSSHPLHDSDDK